MMYRFSSRSKANLATCSKNIQDLFNQIIKDFDCTIVEGHRNQERQEKMFLTGRSKARWGQSKHNTLPSEAVDVVPYLRGIDWRGEYDLMKAIRNNDMASNIMSIVHNIERWTYFAGVVVGTAKTMGINMRWGGDWYRDTNLADQIFDDWPHYELVR